MRLSGGAENKWKKLLRRIKNLGSAAVAFSGGVDSSLLALAAKKALGKKALAVTINSPTLAPGELENAKRVAGAIGIAHLVINHDELANEEFSKNPENRCYYCKSDTIEILRRAAEQRKIAAVLEGTNADDLQGYRPGYRAVREQGAVSPLAEVGLTKSEVRELAKQFDLPNAQKPSMACLSSRIPYGEEITPNKLRMIGSAEKIIKEILGAEQVRVRMHEGGQRHSPKNAREYGRIARIELGDLKKAFDEKKLAQISEKLRKLGFAYVTLDLRGYRTGSMNEVISPRRRQ